MDSIAGHEETPQYTLLMFSGPSTCTGSVNSSFWPLQSLAVSKMVIKRCLFSV